MVYKDSWFSCTAKLSNQKAKSHPLIIFSFLLSWKFTLYNLSWNYVLLASSASPKITTFHLDYGSSLLCLILLHSHVFLHTSTNDSKTWSRSIICYLTNFSGFLLRINSKSLTPFVVCPAWSDSWPFLISTSALLILFCINHTDLSTLLTSWSLFLSEFHIHLRNI